MCAECQDICDNSCESKPLKETPVIIEQEKEVEEKGGIGALLLDSRENKVQMEKLQEQMEAMQLLMKTQFEQLNAQLQQIA